MIVIRDSNTYLKSSVINFDFDKRIAVWCYLQLKDLITNPLNSLKGIAITAERPYGTLKLNVDRPAVLRQYYGMDVIDKKSKEIIGRRTYGINENVTMIGTDPTGFVTKPFGYYLLKISNVLTKHLRENIKLFSLEHADLSKVFNHCTILLYYAKSNLKRYSSLGYHTDVTYDHNGKYITSRNGQLEDTPTVVLTIGNSRKLNWQRQILVKGENGRRKWITDKCWKDHMILNDCSITIVNSLDERPTFDPSSGHIVRYRHGGVTVKGTSISTGFAFRVVKDRLKYDDRNKILDTSNYPVFDHCNVENNFDKVNFHKQIKELFESVYTF